MPDWVILVLCAVKTDPDTCCGDPSGSVRIRLRQVPMVVRLPEPAELAYTPSPAHKNLSAVHKTQLAC